MGRGGDIARSSGALLSGRRRRPGRRPRLPGSTSAELCDWDGFRPTLGNLRIERYFANPDPDGWSGTSHWQARGQLPRSWYDFKSAQEFTELEFLVQVKSLAERAEERIRGREDLQTLEFIPVISASGSENWRFRAGGELNDTYFFNPHRLQAARKVSGIENGHWYLAEELGANQMLALYTDYQRHNLHAIVFPVLGREG